MNDTTIKDPIQFVLNDNRLCSSPNLKKFFKKKINQVYNRVIRFNGRLWFAMLGWDPDGKGFAGVKVAEVACLGNKAKTGYPVPQNPGMWEDVTEWFWEKYQERGRVSLPEVWHIPIPPQLTHAELHTN